MERHGIAYIPWSASNPIDVRISIIGPSGIGITPIGTAFIEHYDPYSNSIVVDTFPIGGQYSASYVTVTTGSIGYPGVGEIKVRVVDSFDFTFLGDRMRYFPEEVNRLLAPLGIIDAAVGGVSGTSGYSIMTYLSL